MSYDHVIFDNDGVILDSTTDNLEWMEKFRVREARKYGVDMTLEQSKKIFKANSAREIREVAQSTGLGVEQLREIEVAKTQKKIEKIRNGEIGVFDSTEEVLSSITSKKSMVSNAPLKATEFSLKHYGLDKHFNTVRSPTLDSIEDYMEKKKPNPEMIEKTIREETSKNPIYIGDSDTDIMAAEKAGIDSIHVKTSGDTDTNPTYSVGGIEEIPDIIE